MYRVFQSALLEQKEGRDFVLVSIVSEDGSSPRGAGSMMLVGPSGRFAGSIGGGAVEKQAKDIALQHLSDGTSGMRSFLLQNNKEENTGMICGGRISVLFSYIPAHDPIWMRLTEVLLEFGERNTEGWLLLSNDGNPPELLDESGALVFGETFMKQELLSRINCVQIEHTFAIPLPANGRAVIFGGGHIAFALAPLLKDLDFHVAIFDDRPDYAVKERFPVADLVICGDYAHIEDFITLNRHDFVVIITDGHRHDFEVECQALTKPLAYIGAIGSKAKTAEVNRKLLECGFSENDLKRLHAPIGTKIKAVTPMEIAVSIAGEMIRVRVEGRERGKVIQSICPMS